MNSVPANALSTHRSMFFFQQILWERGAAPIEETCDGCSSFFCTDIEISISIPAFTRTIEDSMIPYQSSLELKSFVLFISTDADSIVASCSLVMTHSSISSFVLEWSSYRIHIAIALRLQGKPPFFPRSISVTSLWRRPQLGTEHISFFFLSLSSCRR
jgi:hypothetical protein